MGFISLVRYYWMKESRRRGRVLDGDWRKYLCITEWKWVCIAGQWGRYQLYWLEWAIAAYKRQPLPHSQPHTPRGPHTHTAGQGNTHREIHLDLEKYIQGAWHTYSIAGKYTQGNTPRGPHTNTAMQEIHPWKYTEGNTPRGPHTQKAMRAGIHTKGNTRDLTQRCKQRQIWQIYISVLLFSKAWLILRIVIVLSH